MSEKYYSQDQLNLIATAAIASINVTKGMTEDEWARAVIRRATSIQRMRLMNEDGILMGALDSARILAKVISVTYEESSCRYVIEYSADNSNYEGTERIRTPRMDGREGAILEREVEKLKAAAGTDKKVVIYKHNEMPTEEQAEKSRKSGKMVPSNGYRTAVWFDFLD
jgi:hypothetical protein